jgi:putative peptidoglycan lipid II flippase
VALTIVLGYLFALPLRAYLGLPATWGAAGLTISAGMAGWVEFTLLRRAVNRRIGKTGIPARRLATLWGSAVLAAAVALGIHTFAPKSRPLLAGVLVIAAYGATYVASTWIAGVEDAVDNVGRITRRLGLRPRPRGNAPR